MKDKKKLRLLNEQGAYNGLGFLVGIILPMVLWSGLIVLGMDKIEDYQTQEVGVGQEIRISTDSNIMDSLQFPVQLSILDKTDDYISFVVREAGTYRIDIGRSPRYYIKAKEGTNGSCITLQNYSYFWITMLEIGVFAICFLGIFTSIGFIAWITDKIYLKQE